MKKIYLFFVLVVAGVFRFYNNTAVSLWHDEAFSALYIGKYAWGEMMHRIILDVHPPLYYILLRFWNYIFGDSLLSLRGFSIILGVLTVWAGYLLIKRAFGNEKWALFAAFLLAINPYQTQYSLEARMYTLGTFLVLLSSYLLVRALEEKKKILWVFYGITVAACAYTHYFLLFSVAAQGLYWLYYCIKTNRLSFIKSQEFIWGVGAYIFSVILYIPWIPSFIEQNTRVSSGYWIAKPDMWAVPGTIWKMMFGGQGMNRPWLIVGSVVTLFLVVYFIKKINRPAKWLILLSIIIPILAAVAISLKTAIYQDRYFVFTSLFFVMLVALAISQINSYPVRRTLSVLLIIITVVTFFKNWQDLDVKNLFTDRGLNKKPGMAKAAELVNEQARPSDKIFVGSSFIFFTFQYYNETSIRPLLLSSITLDKIPHFSGTAIMEESDLQLTNEGLLPADAVEKNNNVWLIWTTGFGGSKPNVPGNWSIVQEQNFQDTPGFKGQIVVTEYHIR